MTRYLTLVFLATFTLNAFGALIGILRTPARVTLSVCQLFCADLPMGNWLHKY